MNPKTTPKAEKHKCDVRYMIELPNNTLNVTGLAICLENMFERLDRIEKSITPKDQ